MVFLVCHLSYNMLQKEVGTSQFAQMILDNFLSSFMILDI